MVQAEWGREGGPDPEGLESFREEEARTQAERDLGTVRAEEPSAHTRAERLPEPLPAPWP